MADDLSQIMGYESPFGSSPFGQYWEKNLPAWARSTFGPAKILDRPNIVIADLSYKVSYKQADFYSKLASTPDKPKYNFRIFADPDGVKVLESYNNPNKYPSSDEVLVFIETDDGRFDFGRIVRVKLGKAVVDDLMNKYFQEWPGDDIDPDDLADKLINSAWEVSNDSNYNAAGKDIKSDDDIRDLLIEAIEREYDGEKFDDLSWFIIALKGIDFIIGNIDDWLFDFASWIRSKKYEEEKYWNGSLPDNKYSPAFFPDFLVIQDKEMRENLLKSYLSPLYTNSRAYLKEKLDSDNPFYAYAYKVSTGIVDSLEAFTDSIAEKLAQIYIPSGSILTIIKHWNAFLVGLWNGILEILAGIVELLALVYLFFTDELGFRIGDKIVEGFENFLGDLRYNTHETFMKAFEGGVEAFLDFAVWYNHYEGMSYLIAKEIGELVPEVIMWLVPELKAGQLARAERLSTGVERRAARESLSTLSEQERRVISQRLKEEIENGNARRMADDAARETQEKILVRTHISEQQRLIDGVDDGTIKLDEWPDGKRRKAGDNTRYSNYAEMKADLYFESHTFTIGENTGTLRRVSLEKVDNIDNSIRQGIDGVYEFSDPPPKYVITEVKMNTTGRQGWQPSVNRTITKSGGSQMTDTWIEFNLRKELGDLKALEINAEGYEKVLVGISQDKTPILITLDENAKALKKTNIKLAN